MRGCGPTERRACLAKLVDVTRMIESVDRRGRSNEITYANWASTEYMMSISMANPIMSQRFWKAIRSCFPQEFRIDDQSITQVRRLLTPYRKSLISPAFQGNADALKPRAQFVLAHMRTFQAVSWENVPAKSRPRISKYGRRNGHEIYA